MNYKVIASHDLDEFQDLVNTALKEGWELQGGVATSKAMVFQGGGHVETVLLLQAMTK